MSVVSTQSFMVVTYRDRGLTTWIVACLQEPYVSESKQFQGPRYTVVVKPLCQWRIINSQMDKILWGGCGSLVAGHSRACLSRDTLARSAVAKCSERCSSRWFETGKSWLWASELRGSKDITLFTLACMWIFLQDGYSTLTLITNQSSINLVTSSNERRRVLFAHSWICQRTLLTSKLPVHEACPWPIRKRNVYHIPLLWNRY